MIKSDKKKWMFLQINAALLSIFKFLQISQTFELYCFIIHFLNVTLKSTCLDFYTSNYK